MRVTEENYLVLKRVEDLLGTAYGMNLVDDDFRGIIDDDILIDMIDDLCSEIDRLNETIDDQKVYYEEMIKEYYKPINKYEFYGVNEQDL